MLRRHTEAKLVVVPAPKSKRNQLLPGSKCKRLCRQWQTIFFDDRSQAPAGDGHVGQIRSKTIGEVDGGRGPLGTLLTVLRTGAASEMLGLANGATDMTMAYLRDRRQFGQAIGSFQALQHRMADLFADLAQMRSAVEGGLQAIDSGFGVAQAATVAKAEANRVLHLISNQGIQLHGGIGMTDEYDVGFYLKRARVLESSWGSSSYLRDRFARLSKY